MRVLHVDHTDVLGGAERSILELARAQRASGIDARVAVGRQGPFAAALEKAGIPCLDLGWSSRYVDAAARDPSAALALTLPDAIRAVRPLRAAIGSVRPDIVHAHTRKAQLVAALAVEGRRGVPLVWHLRDDLPARGLLRRPVTAALSRASHAVALTGWLRERYEADAAYPRSGAIGIVPSSVDQGPLAALSTPWLDGQRTPVAGFVGQIAAWKAPHVVIDAAERTADVGVRYAIVGDVWFPRSEAAYGAWLERRLRTSSARDRIVRLSTRDPAAAFEAIDILCHTSAAPEPFGRVLVEAMAARRPVVAYRKGSTTELLGQDGAAFAATADGAGVADAVRRLVGDRSAAIGLAAAGQRSARRFAPDVVAAVMSDEYEYVR